MVRKYARYEIERPQVPKKKSKSAKKALVIGVLIIFCVVLFSIFTYSSMKQNETSGDTIATQVPSASTQITGEKNKDGQHYSLAPGFTLVDIYGEKFSLSDSKGKIVILDYMGATCKPCKEQVAELGRVYSEYGNKVEIISLSVNGGKGMTELLQTFADLNDVKWKIAIDTEGSSFKNKVMYIPTTILIDQDGYVRFKHQGVATASTLIQEIKAIMGES